MARPMTDAEKARARAEYKADASVSVQELADEFGVSRSAMLRALAGITRPPGGIVRAKITTAQMERLRASGLTLYEIAKQAGITESGVHRRLNRSGNGTAAERPAGRSNRNREAS